MQNFRLLPAIVAVTLCAAPILTRADDTPQQAAARDALMQQMNGTDNGVQDTNIPAITPAQPETMPATPPPAATAPVETTMPPATPPPMTVTPPLTTPETGMTNMVMATNTIVQYPVNPATASAPNMEQMTAPPVPLTAAQEQQLQDLLSQYQANQITPAQYQTQRAKILSGQ